MSGIDPTDRLPLLGAVVVMLLGNVAGYLAGVTVFVTILFAPLAAVVFAAIKYTLHGDPYPVGMRP